MMYRYDVVVVGAGPVGLATAVALQRAHFSVALVDKFPLQDRPIPAQGREGPLPASDSEEAHGESLPTTPFLHPRFSPERAGSPSCSPEREGGAPSTAVPRDDTPFPCMPEEAHGESLPITPFLHPRFSPERGQDRHLGPSPSKTASAGSLILREEKTLREDPPDPWNTLGGQACKWFALGADVLHWLESLGFALPYQPLTHLRLSCEHQQPPIILDSAQAQEPFLTGVVQSHELSHQGRKNAQEIPQFSPDEIIAWEAQEHHWRLTLASGMTLETPLVLGADGGNSGVRAFFNPPMRRWDFQQKAVVFLLKSVPTGWAYEHFFPQGSLAVLSLLHGRGAGIWMGPPREVADLKVSEVVYDMLGLRSEVASKPSIFEVRGHGVDQRIFPRCCLLGDAAHALHPLAGQGLNLGLRQARSLVQRVIKRRSLGLDWGLGLGDLAPLWSLESQALHGGTRGLLRTLCGVNSSLWWSLGHRLLGLDWARQWLIHTAAGKMVEKNPLSKILRPFFSV